MELSDFPPLLACFIGGGMGLYGLFKPEWIAQITRLQATAPEGRSEIRASFAGLFFALHTVVAILLLTRNSCADVSAATVGAGWLGACFGRGLSFVYDDAYTRLNRYNLLLEAFVGLCLITPVLF